MTARNKGLADQKTLVWNAENRLSEVQDSNGNLIESYWYDIDGARVKKVSGATTTYTFFGHYEEEVSGGSTTEIRHYSFGSLRIAVKRGSTLYHLHGDHLGSTSLTTAGSAVEASRAYYAYGAERNASGDLKTDRTFTGQKSDASGLLYYNARYYDPALGTFISPDSLVPNAGRIIDYNRFLYARGNPLKYSDPSGHASAASIGEWEAKNRWYEARGYAWSGSHWDKPIAPRFKDVGAFIEVALETEAEWFIGQIKASAESEAFRDIAALNKRSAEIFNNAINPGPTQEEATALLFIAGGFRIEAYFKWIDQVKANGPWDFKVQERFQDRPYSKFGDYGYDRDIWGNIHYGIIGTALGFTSFELLAGAGAGHARDNGLKLELKGSNFDAPKDQSAIQMGIDLYDPKKGLDINVSDFMSAFLTYHEHLNRLEWETILGGK